MNVNVLRNGVKETIHRDKILVGDIIFVKGGIELPADGIIL